MRIFHFGGFRLRNYYQLLEINRVASFEEVKAAYRRKALRHHPDRGGSHAEMVAINEAWEVLSDPTLRGEYDQHLKAGTANEATFDEARQRSRNYEKNWGKFDSWLSSISRDFDSAQFGSKKMFGMDMPTASKSVSAWVFLITGGLVGLFVWLVLLVSILVIGAEELKSNPSQTGVLFRLALFSCVASMAAGAWGGKWTHQNFGARIAGWLSKKMPFSFFSAMPVAVGNRSKQTASDATAPHNNVRFTNCPNCEQKLRMPPSAKTLAITCPKCQTRFDSSNQMNQERNNRMNFPPNKTSLATLLRCLLIFEIVFTVICVPLVMFVGAMGEQILTEAGLASPEPSMFLVATWGVLMLVLLPMGIGSWVGLFQHRNWGRWLYLIGSIASQLFIVFAGCFTWTYSWDLVSALGSIGYLTNGIILSICFLSPLASEFETPRPNVSS